MLFDIHSHILPGVDDGAKTLEESLQLLTMLKEQGVDVVAATPHFYAEKIDFSEHLGLVKERFDLLKQNITPDMPSVLQGFEVRYFRGISGTSAIKELTLGGSQYLLLEFAYGKDIDQRTVNDVANIFYNFGITPILAHLERYYKYKGFKDALKLVDEGVAVAHVNASSFFDPYKKAALKLIDSQVASFIASDTHSVQLRPPMFNEAKRVINKYLGDGVAEGLFANTENLYNEIINSSK